MIGLDTETTGVDLRHGAMPFFVTTYDPAAADGKRTLFWQWDVDPLTRRVAVPTGDVEEIGDVLFASGDRGPVGDDADQDRFGLILQNPKFDFAALRTVGLWDVYDVGQAWGAVRDTLMAAHLLHSNQPKNLTALAVRWLNLDIEPYELRLKEAVTKARTWCRRFRPDWATAKESRPDMPSCKASAWRFDYWLPRAVILDAGPDAVSEWAGADVSWWETVLAEYANADPAVTVEVWRRMRPEIVRRGLWDIYLTRLKALPVAYRMESRGVSLSAARLRQQVTEYGAEAARLGDVCVNLAATYRDDSADPPGPYTLTLPKAGNNGSLTRFCFDVLGLEPLRSKKAKTDAPTLDKTAIGHYLETLPPRSKALAFVKALAAKRQRDTALQYMAGYQQFWKKLGGDFKVLHPSLNPTGTDTLRWSSSSPNEQNISKREGFNLRYSFGPGPGREWWSLDAKNIELRIPFYKCGQKELIELFERPDDPPYYGSNHLANFHAVYPDVWDAAVKEVGPDKAGPHCKKKYASTYYQWCKNGGFCKQYGGQEALTDATFRRPGAYKLLAEKFGKLEDLNRQQIAFAERHGYVETVPDKTVDPARGYPLMVTRTSFGGVLPTVPMSYFVQGTAMWWTMKAMLRLEELFAEWNRRAGVGPHDLTHPAGYYLTMQVHDEVVLDFPRRADPRTNPKASNLARVREVQRVLELGGDDIGVPTPAGVEYHPDNWSEGITF